jgi:hypothetical protein
VIFHTKVAGISCQCKVLEYEPPAPLLSLYDLNPPDPGVFDFELLNREGKRTRWLESKVTPEIAKTLAEEFRMTGKYL